MSDPQKEAADSTAADQETACAKGTKRGLDAEELQVESANKWEEADLGDHDRKNKFLRLMGAGKKEHTGKFVIGDNAPAVARMGDDVATTTENLESQFNASLDQKLSGAARRHTGFGFSDPPPSPPARARQHSEGEVTAREAESTKAKDVKTDEAAASAASEAGAPGEPDSSSESSKPKSTPKDDIKTKKMPFMSFVKSSS